MEVTNDLTKLFFAVYVTLGGTSIEVELEDDDYNVAFDEAIRMYRQHSSNSIVRGWYALQAQPGQHKYSLPADIDNIIELRRFRGGFFTNPSGNFEPFAAAFIQQTLAGAGSSTTFPGLVQFEALSEYTELLERMFASNLLYEFNEGDSELYIWQTLRSDELVGVHCSQLKSIDKLLKGSASYLWLMKYTLAGVKMILGEKYSKSNSMPGPQGGITLKGEQLKQAGEKEKSELILALIDQSDGGASGMPIWG